MSCSFNYNSIHNCHNNKQNNSNDNSCFSKYLAKEFNTTENALIKGFFGTHTHVQTADEQIINGMSYITDAGFCGASDGVIGMEYATSLKRLSTSLPERYEIAQSAKAQINGVEVLIDRTKATQIKKRRCYQTFWLHQRFSAKSDTKTPKDV